MVFYPMKDKVYAYVLRSDDCRDRLLAFTHKAFPDVPMLVPGGTLEEGEDPQECMKRKVFEESGLACLYDIEKLGETDLTDAEGMEEFHTHFFVCRSEKFRDTWEHTVTGDGEDQGMVFQYRWLPPQKVLLVYDYYFHIFMRPEYLPTLFTDESLLGLANDTISLMPWTPLWEKEFANARDELLSVLPGADIEHVGSTSVPDLPAKPIIDMAISVNGPELHIESVEGCGYHYMGEKGVSGRFYFVKGPSYRRTHHIHMFEKGNPIYQEHLTFRDTLREYPYLAREYGKLKLRLWRELSSDRKTYTESKSQFIEDIICSRWKNL